MKREKSLSIIYSSDDIWININGVGDCQTSPSLRECFNQMLNEGRHHYVINLMYCHWMDSTFMGTITGLAQRLKKFHDGELRVVNVSKNNQELMENLGLHQLFLISPLDAERAEPPSCIAFEVPLGCGKPKTKPLARKHVRQTVLSAHRSLVKANQANKRKFQNVLDAFKPA